MPMPGQAGPVVVTGAPTGAAAGVGKKEEKPRIVIKQTVKQIQGVEKKRRKKTVSASNRQALNSKKSEYLTLKKAVKKALTAGKQAQYTRENAKIKQMKRSLRVAARKKLRESLKAKHGQLVKQLPSTGRMSYKDVVSLINKIKRIKW